MESIFRQRHLSAFMPMVSELLDLMKTVAQQLQGEALERFALRLGVSTTADGEDWGIAQDFNMQEPFTKAMAEFKQRFATLRDEFDLYI